MSDFDHPKMQVTHSCSPEVEVQTKNAKRYVKCKIKELRLKVKWMNKSQIIEGMNNCIKKVFPITIESQWVIFRLQKIIHCN